MPADLQTLCEKKAAAGIKSHADSWGKTVQLHECSFDAKRSLVICANELLFQGNQTEGVATATMISDT